MAYINYAPMRIGTEDPWTLTELAKAGGLGGAAPPPQPRGGLGGTPYLGNCLSVPWFVTGPLRAG